eukprot:1162053-Pelagomonas_calceolata.AAC.9
MTQEGDTAGDLLIVADGNVSVGQPCSAATIDPHGSGGGIDGALSLGSKAVLSLDPALSGQTSVKQRLSNLEPGSVKLTRFGAGHSQMATNKAILPWKQAKAAMKPSVRNLRAITKLCFPVDAVASNLLSRTSLHTALPHKLTPPCCWCACPEQMQMQLHKHPHAPTIHCFIHWATFPRQIVSTPAYLHSLIIPAPFQDRENVLDS